MMAVLMIFVIILIGQRQILIMKDYLLEHAITLITLLMKKYILYLNLKEDLFQTGKLMMLYGQSEISQFADLKMLSMIFQLQILFVMMFHSSQAIIKTST